MNDSISLGAAETFLYVRRQLPTILAERRDRMFRLVRDQKVTLHVNR